MKKLRMTIVSIFTMLVICTSIAACDSGKQEKANTVVDNRVEASLDSNLEKCDYFVLVNKENKLPENWKNIITLAEEKDTEGSTIYVEKKALEQFYKLREELLNEGIDIELDSTYRSVEEQQQIWDEFTEEYGIDYVKKYVAVPGFSEHHTGLAIDVCLIIDGKVVNDNDEMIAQKEIFSKIHKKLAKYGFILRYLEGKEDITGYGYEPWHFRYIDDVQIATEIMNSGITLEEYLKK